MTNFNKLEVNEEAGNVTKSKNGDGTLGDQKLGTDAPLKELTERLTTALTRLDRGRALFIVVSALVGNKPDQEVAMTDPDTGRVLAYVVPPAQRHAAVAAARRLEHAAADSGPGRTIRDVLDRANEEVA